eukprot:g14432.t1
MAVPEFCHDDCLCADVSGLFAKREKALKTLRAKLHPDKFSHQSPEQAALATRLFQDLTRFYDRAAPRQSYGLPGVDNHLTADDIVLKVHCANARLQIALSGNNCHTTEEDFDFFTNARTWDDLHLGRAKTALVTTWFGAATEEIKEEIACNGPVVLTIAAGGRAGAQEDVLVVGWSGDQEQDDALGFRPDGSRDHENSAGEKWLVWRADDDRKLSWLPMLAPHPKVTFIPREALQDVEVFTPEPYLAIPPSHVDPGWQQWPKLRLRIRAEDDADLLHDVWAAVASSELGGIAGLIVGEKKTRIHIHECGKKTGSRAASLTNMKYEPTTRTWTAHFAFG